jgi:ATP-dependent Clp protease ATP-binding subunit ClpC
MFERFTDRARRVVVEAQEEARLLRHSYIGTEHLLLGLLREGGGVAAEALQRLDISLDVVRVRVGEVLGESALAPDPSGGHIPFTPRVKKVLELSLREAIKIGDSYIGTEHILLGLLAEGDGVAVQVLTEFGADNQRIREQVTVVRQSRAGDLTPIRVPLGGRPGRRDRGQVAGLQARIDLLEARLSSLNTEVDRLRELLTRHGIDWTDPGSGDAIAD